MGPENGNKWLSYPRPGLDRLSRRERALSPMSASESGEKGEGVRPLRTSP